MRGVRNSRYSRSVSAQYDSEMTGTDGAHLVQEELQQAMDSLRESYATVSLPKIRNGRKIA
eukprot:3564298-Rhodomonas_salina.1